MFERALRERDRYELWRVYRAADCNPIAKCFRNPAELIAMSRIALELGTAPAIIEISRDRLRSRAPLCLPCRQP